jgi:hypothetical protein
MLAILLLVVFALQATLPGSDAFICKSTYFWPSKHIFFACTYLNIFTYFQTFSFFRDFLMFYCFFGEIFRKNLFPGIK